jgi:hypothetical protein
MNFKVVDEFFGIFVEDHSSKNPFEEIRIAKTKEIPTSCKQFNDLYHNEKIKNDVK